MYYCVYYIVIVFIIVLINTNAHNISETIFI